MRTSLDLLQIRYLQITCTMMIFVAIEQFFHFPHSYWIIIAGAIIYAGFDPDVVLQRAYLRFSGNITGVAAVVIVATIIHWNYRFAVIFIVIISWAVVYLQLIPYNRFMIPITIFSDMFSEITNSSDFLLLYYFIDRVIDTVIAFAVCILLEFLIFGNSYFTVIIYKHLQKKVHNGLNEFYQLALTRRVTRARLMKIMHENNRSIFRLQELISHQEYLPKLPDFYQESQTITTNFLQQFHKIVSLVYLKHNDPNNPYIETLKQEIAALLVDNAP